MTPPREPDARKIDAEVAQADFFALYWGRRYIEVVRDQNYDRGHAVGLIYRAVHWGKVLATLRAVGAERKDCGVQQKEHTDHKEKNE